MSDDIVTRLRGLNAASYHLLCNEAADEIERLWELSFNDIYFGQLKLDEIEYLQAENERLRSDNRKFKLMVADIAYAVINEGKNPAYHRKQISYVRKNWTTLWNAVSKAVEAVKA